MLILGAATVDTMYALVGDFVGANRSAFVGSGGSAGPVGSAGKYGSSIDALSGPIYAAAVMQRWKNSSGVAPPPLLFAWVRGMCHVPANITRYNSSWSSHDSSALSLPRTVAVDEHDRPMFEVAPELRALRIGPVAAARGLTLPPRNAAKPVATPVALPAAANGDAVEIIVTLPCQQQPNATLSLALRSTGAAATPVAGWEGAFLTLALSGANGMTMQTRSDPSFRCFSTSLADSSKAVSPPPLLGAATCVLRVFVDHSVVSVSLNGGLRTLTGRVYPSQPAAATKAFLLNGGGAAVAVGSVEAWGMRSIWQPSSAD